jgi:hypothetical protein
MSTASRPGVWNVELEEIGDGSNTIQLRDFLSLHFQSE